MEVPTLILDKETYDFLFECKNLSKMANRKLHGRLPLRRTQYLYIVDPNPFIRILEEYSSKMFSFRLKSGAIA